MAKFPGMTSVRLLLALALVGCALVAAPVAPAAAEPVPAGYTYTDHWFTSYDGTQLHAGVFLPSDRAADEKHPVLMNIGPYTAPNGGITGATDGGLNTSGIVNRNPELFSHPGLRNGRYAYVQVDSRGFGGSGGCFGYYMEPERKDAKVAIEWAADQAWSTGKVGMWGKSYDGAQQVLALAARPRGLAATVIQAPGLSGYTALWHNGVHYATGRFGTTFTYSADDISPPQNQTYLADQKYAAAAAAPATSVPNQPTCRSDAAMMNAIADRSDPYWADKEPYKDAAGADTPTFWVHGYWDANTKPVGLDIWSSLTGPKQAWFGQFTHKRGHETAVGRSQYFLDEAFRFLDLHVRGIEPAQADPKVTVQQGDGEGVWREEAQWPPADAQPWTMPVRAGSYPDIAGNNATGSSAGKGYWSVTEPLPHAAHMAGEAVVKANVSTVAPYARVIALLYDIDPDGKAKLVQRGAFAGPKTGAQEVTVTLYPQDWKFEEGHRIGVHLVGSEDTWYHPGTTGTTVTVSGGQATLPFLRYERTEFLDGGRSDGMSNATATVPAATLQSATVQADPPPAQETRPTEGG